MHNQTQLTNTLNFFYESGTLAYIPRSFYFFLNEKHAQSVAEHSFRTAIIGYSLAMLDGKADPNKTMAMCLFHDLSETRISDLNYVHQRYVNKKEIFAIEDLANPLPFGQQIKSVINEYETKLSIESRLAKDADQVELLLTIKELSERGNTKGLGWFDDIIQRLTTEPAKALAAQILNVDSDHWWKKSTGVNARTDKDLRSM